MSSDQKLTVLMVQEEKCTTPGRSEKEMNSASGNRRIDENGGCFKNRIGKFKVLVGNSFSEVWYFISNLCIASEVPICVLF